MRWIARAGALLVALVAFGAAAASAAAVGLQSIGAYTEPVFVTSDPGDPDRLFVVERAGIIKQTTPAGTSTFADLTAEVRDDHSERGLLSVALAPDFAASGLLYVFYTRQPDGALQVSELRASGDAAVPGSLRPVIDIPHADAPNHNGGQLQFGPDGYLYIGTGDGGDGNDPWGNAQSLDVNLGKLLRIDPRRSAGRPYSVPPDNPFADGPGNDEIWSSGLRNPFRFSFDRGTGALTIGDVGQSSWEEVNHVPGPAAGRGLNFGWDCREGLAAGTAPGPGPCPARAAFTDPIHQYENEPSTGGCAITGGYVVRDPGLTELIGRYVYADYCVGDLRSLAPALPTDDRSVGLDVANPSSFGEDSCGRVYVASLTEDAVWRLVDSTPTQCSIAPPPAEDCTVRIEGDGKANQLKGGPGSQAMFGFGGDDRLRGGEGDDCLEGGPKDDVLVGGGGADVLRSGTGDDVIRARDGERDRVACGKGRDVAVTDRADRVRGCERERKGAA